LSTADETSHHTDGARTAQKTFPIIQLSGEQVDSRYEDNDLGPKIIRPAWSVVNAPPSFPYAESRADQGVTGPAGVHYAADDRGCEQSAFAEDTSFFRPGT